MILGSLVIYTLKMIFYLLAASVHSLSVSIGVPFSKNLVESFYLEYFMRGIQNEIEKDEALLASGHSYQTEEPAITVTMNGNKIEKSNKSLSN